MYKTLWFLLITLTLQVQAQNQWPRAIADNSFLIEEAYNQEPRVVQHCITAMYTRQHDQVEYMATQEWPVAGQLHQLSYSIPFNTGKPSGIGDVYLNYRYQLLFEESGLSISPRFSIILPAGSAKNSLGSGKTGYQLNLPVSHRWAAQWVSHLNAGATFTPGVKVGTGHKTLKGFHGGASLIWLVRSDLNLMVEWLSSMEDAAEASKVAHKTTHFVNPGMRYAKDIGTLQLVPGMSVPIEVRNRTASLFFYISVEHPF